MRQDVTEQEVKSVTDVPKIILGPCTYNAIEKFPGDQVHIGQEVMGMIIQLTSKNVRSNVMLSIDSVTLEVTNELEDVFIYKLNIYPVKQQNIKKKVLNDYYEFQRLSNYPKTKRGESYKIGFMEINQRLERVEMLTKKFGLNFVFIISRQY